MINPKTVIAIIKKELNLYVATLSNFIVYAIVLGATAFLFFNSFYDVGVAHLGGLFNLFPWVFALLIPAVAMGIVAQERQDKTLQYLLAQPITDIEIIVGKFIGGWIFLAVFPLVSIIIPISLSSVAQFDQGVILAGYIGTLLLIGLFLAVDTFISTMFTNGLAVFVVAFVVNFLLILVGSSTVGNIIPGDWVNYVVNVSPLDHYSRVVRGLIESADLLYFALAILAFLLLAIWQVRLIRGGELDRKKVFAGLTVQGLAIALLVGTYFTFLVPGRWDITDQKIYTLASGTKNIIQDIAEEVTFDLYLSTDLPPAFQPRVEDLNRLVEEIQAQNMSQVVVNAKNPDGDQALQQEAATLGIYPQSFTVVSQTEYQAKEGYMGVNIKYQDQNRTLPFIGETNDLEYAIMSRIYEMVRTEKPVVAYLKGESATGLNNSASGFFNLLDSVYDVKIIDLAHATEDARLQNADFDQVEMMIIGEVIEELHPDDVALIQQQVQAGTALIVFSDGIDLDLNTLSAQPTEMLEVNKILSEWEITISKNVVYDQHNPNLLTFSTQQGQMLLPYAFWPTIEVQSDHPLLEDFSTLMTPWASSIDFNPDKGAKPLLRTSKFGGIMLDQINLAPDQELSETDLDHHTLGVQIARSEENGDIFVIGTENIILDDFNRADGTNVIFSNLLVDIGAQGTDLATIKAKNRTPPQLVFSDESQRDSIRLFNLLGGPGLILIIGGVFWYLRKKQTEKVYNPNNV